MLAATVLDHLFEPLSDLSPEAAREIVALRLDPALQSRLDEFADLANRGQLSAEDRELYEQYIDGLDVLAVVKSKARAALKKSSA
jgi:hypothetical protein